MNIFHTAGKHKRKLIVTGIFLGIVLIIILNVVRGGKDTTVGDVETTVLKKKNIEQWILAEGIADASRKETFYTETAGTVLQMKVKPGQEVKKGDVLAIMDDNTALTKYMEARTNHSSAQNELEETLLSQVITPEKNKLSLAKAEQVVNKALLALDKVKGGDSESEIAKAKMALEQAQNGLETLRLEYDRDQITPQEIEIAKKRVKSAEDQYRYSTWAYDFDDGSAMSAISSADTQIKEAKLELSKMQKKYELQQKEQNIKLANAENEIKAAQITLDEIVRGDKSKEADFDLQDAQATLQLARLEAQEAEILPSKLDNLNSRMEQADSDLNQAKEELDDCTIRAGIDGIVLEAPFSDGELTKDGDVVVSIGQIDQLNIEGNIDEAEIGQLSGNEEATILSKAFPNKTFKARLISLQPQAMEKDTSNGKVTVFPVRLEAVNDKKMLKPGMNVDIRIISDSRKNVVAVPIAAVVRENTDSFVFVVDKSGLAHKTKVTTGMSNDTEIEIKKGLHEGDKIVSGSYNALQILKDGDQVEDSKK